MRNTRVFIKQLV